MFDPVETLAAFARHASVSADPAYAAGMKGAVEFLGGLFRHHGFAVEEVATEGHPILLAERGRKEHPAVLIYGHYDVQPPDPLGLWETPPFEPQVRGGRMYGRGAADNKGPVIALLAAVVGLLEETPELPLRIIFVVEGEEEIGSASFVPFLRQYRKRLDAAYVLLADTGSHRPEQVVITTGLRGIAALELELTGPRTDLHSGVHGGAVRNPIEALARMCATLHDARGEVRVKGFYDDVRPPTKWEREQVRAMGVTEAAYRKFLGVPAFHTRKGVSPLEAVRFHPTLEFNGIGGGYQGEGSKTVIPGRAFVKITCRLVPDQDPADILRKVKAHLQEALPAGVKMRIGGGHCGRPYVVVPPAAGGRVAPALAAAFEAADAGAEKVFGAAPLYLREGGSVPIIAEIRKILGLDSLMLGLYLPEDALHAPNESFHLGMMANGTTLAQEILAASAGA